MPRQLTEFQRRSLSSLANFLTRRDILFRQRLDGRKETYAVVSFEDRFRDYEVYVYEDEVGYSEGDSWKIWETPDFDTDEDLFNAFLADLRTSVDKAGFEGASALERPGGQLGETAATRTATLGDPADD